MRTFAVSDLPANMQNKIRIEDDCWVWTGAKNSKGYGSVAAGVKNRSMLAHRRAYEVFHGPIPVGLTVDHLCRNTLCQNVAHMELVTASENSRRANAARTHCKRGHELSGDNLYLQKRGDRTHRVCRTCQRQFYLDYRARQRLAAA